MSAVPNRGTPRSSFTRRSDPRWSQYAEEKNAWIRKHPGASWKEVEKASKEIAQRLGL